MLHLGSGGACRWFRTRNIEMAPRISTIGASITACPSVPFSWHFGRSHRALRLPLNLTWELDEPTEEEAALVGFILFAVILGLGFIAYWWQVGQGAGAWA